MRVAALLTVALLLATPGCLGKFRDADHRISDRLGEPENGTHYRVYTFSGEPDATEFVFRYNYQFESWTRLTFYNAGGKMYNETLLGHESWESRGEEWRSAVREEDDWSGTWTFTVETKGPAWYTFGFYFE